MRSILINPYDQTIREYDLRGSARDGYYQGLKAALDDNWIQQVRIDQRHVIWVDEEGLLKPNPVCFQHAAYPQPLAGKGLVTGVSPEGDTTECKLSLENIVDRVIFPTKKFLGIVTTEEEIEHPIFGKIFQITRTAKFEGDDDAQG